MPVNIYAPTRSDALSAEELALYHLIMDYRVANGLSVIPLSEGLTVTAGRHAVDSYENIFKAGLDLPAGANLHSWSDAPYYGDHRDPAVMWTAPQRLNTSYEGYGFEISAAGYGSIEAALQGWQGSSGHNAVILNTGAWANQQWSAIGVGVEIHNDARYYHVWFGRESDPGGAPVVQGGGSAEVFEGTSGADVIYGAGGNDSLMGAAGADFLDGGRGADRMAGGLGNDFYVVDNAGDVIAGEIAYSAGGGIDTVRAYVNYVQPDNIELVRLGNLGGTGNLNAVGNDAPGTLVGNAGNNSLTGRGGDDQLNGNGGDDRIIGNTGRDTIVGGAGADTFVYTSISESRAGAAQRDVINGFDRGADRIDLSGIDAVQRSFGDDAFAFIGGAAFSGTAGELRTQNLGGANAVLIEGDVSGDGRADFQIFVNLQTSMQAGDFSL